MRLLFLGTASCYPTATRGVSCIALRHDDGSVWLFDCGEGSQIQLQKSSLRPGKITKIFITHMHGDHLFGLPGLMCTLSSQAAFKPDFVLEIFGPHGLRQYVRQTLNLSRSPLSYNYVVHEMMPVMEQLPEDWGAWEVDHDASGPHHPQELPGRQINANDNVWHLLDEHPTVVAGPLKHRVPSWGFVIHEGESPGKLDVERLRSLGGTPGPACAKLKQGVTITLADGTEITPADVLGPPRPGRKVTILGDTCNSDLMANIARASDALVHEATLENSLEESALEKGHSTPRMAATFAERIGTRSLILTHYSQRYHAPGSEASPTIDLLAEEANEVAISCDVLLAQDLMEFNVTWADARSLSLELYCIDL